MKLIRTLFATACLTGAAWMPALAHHLHAQPRHFLAFWSGYQAPAPADLAKESCREGEFWVRGFVSIYAQGGYFSNVP